MVARRWLLLGLLAAGCAADGGDAGDAGVAADGGGDAAPAERIVLAATAGDLDLGFRAAADGTGSSLIGAVRLTDAVGTIEVGGPPIDAVVYQRIDWEAQTGYTLLQALLVAPDRWYVAWLYCRATALEVVWLEGTDGTPLGYEAATGLCSHDATPMTASVALPAVDMPLPVAAGGFAIDGVDLSLDDAGPGRLVLGGAEMVLLPFETVDCRSCGGAGWWEIHALLWRPDAGRACYAILYLRRDVLGSVLVAYALTLPDLSDPAGSVEVPATWSVL